MFADNKRLGGGSVAGMASGATPVQWFRYARSASWVSFARRVALVSSHHCPQAYRRSSSPCIAPPFGYGRAMDTERAFLVSPMARSAWLPLAFARSGGGSSVWCSPLIPLPSCPCMSAGSSSGGGPEGSRTPPA